MSSTCGCHDGLVNAVDKVRRKGFSKKRLPQPFEIKCRCGHSFVMEYHEGQCNHCQMVYGVTPCSNEDINKVEAVGIHY
jgi:hypothetical protein